LSLPLYKKSLEYALCGSIIFLNLHSPQAIDISCIVGSGMAKLIGTLRPAYKKYIPSAIDLLELK
jgi:hypothetical protein